MKWIQNTPIPPPKIVTKLALISKVVTKQDKNNTFDRINTFNQFSANIKWCSDQYKLTLKYTYEKNNHNNIVHHNVIINTAYGSKCSIINIYSIRQMQFTYRSHIQFIDRSHIGTWFPIHNKAYMDFSHKFISTWEKFFNKSNRPLTRASPLFLTITTYPSLKCGFSVVHLQQDYNVWRSWLFHCFKKKSESTYSCLRCSFYGKLAFTQEEKCPDICRAQHKRHTWITWYHSNRSKSWWLLSLRPPV